MINIVPYYVSLCDPPYVNLPGVNSIDHVEAFWRIFGFWNAVDVLGGDSDVSAVLLFVGVPKITIPYFFQILSV